MRLYSAAAFFGTLLVAGASSAAPAHPICKDLGPTLGLGVSDFSAAATWPADAQKQGVAWKFLYIYLVPVNDPQADQDAFLKSKVALAKSLGAIPVFTFYELLELGQQNGITGDGTEPGTVKATLQSAGVMSKYFDRFIAALKVASQVDVPVLMHVEPDSWGFMMWAMGVEGQVDATQIAVKVGGSGHPDVQGFADDASGLGKALLKLRDQYAPTARMGWHASNFRNGTKPEVVASFFSSMGEWDVLLTEQPHLEGDEAMWWLPLDAAKVQTNLAWFSSLSGATHLPILLWQAQIGTTDFHFFQGDTTLLASFASAGLGGVMMDMRPNAATQPANVAPDDYRAHESDALATVPPAASMAGGTAADMRARFIAYSAKELVWPAGSLCAASGGGAGSAGNSGTGGVGGSPGGGGAGSAGAPSSGKGGQGASVGGASGMPGGGGHSAGSAGATPGSDAAPGTGSSTTPGGCGCRAAAGREAFGPAALLALVGISLLRRRRRR